MEPDNKLSPEMAVAEEVHSEGEFVRGTSLWRDAWRRLLKNKLAVFGLIVVALITLASIAESVALSPGHFAHAFRQATGVTPHRYVRERRVERAKKLLSASDLSITEIANCVGCSSPSHFSVLFHRITGVTPRQFRNLD